MKIFRDRKAAGQLLSKHLKQYKARKNTIVLAIPRGGVVVASEIAKKLKLPLDIIVTRKIGAPTQPELALGAVDADGNVIWDEGLLKETGFKKDDLVPVINKEVDEIKRRGSVYRLGKKQLNLLGQTIILVDDGIATGSTTLAAINYLKKHRAKKVILAVPVASHDTKAKVTRGLGKFGSVLVLETPAIFAAVGQFYYEFEPVTDQEVVQLLKSWKISS